MKIEWPMLILGTLSLTSAETMVGMSQVEMISEVASKRCAWQMVEQLVRTKRSEDVVDYARALAARYDQQVVWRACEIFVCGMMCFPEEIADRGEQSAEQTLQETFNLSRDDSESKMIEQVFSLDRSLVEVAANGVENIAKGLWGVLIRGSYKNKR